MNNLNITKITKEKFLNINEDDVMFITSPGRMGDEDGSTFIVKDGNEYIIYRVEGWMYPNRENNIITMEETAKQFPKWHETLKHYNEKDYKGKYNFLYMGFGNGLSIDNSIYDEFEPYLDDLVDEYLEESEGKKEGLRYAAVYNVWMKAFLNMVNDKGYVLKR